MPGQIVIRSSQMGPGQIATPPPPPPRRKKSLSNVGELAGGTAANCFVVSCCCPCVVVEFLILAVYKLPVSVLRRLWKKKGQKLLLKRKRNNNNKGLLEEGELSSVSGVHVHGNNNDVGYVDEVSDFDWKEFEMIKVSVDGSAVELDKQMWDRFNTTGFWRSPSQRYT